MIAAALFATLAGAASGGCADHWKVELNAESFANNGAGRIFDGVDLKRLRNKLEAQLKIAAADACKSGSLKAAKARTVDRVEVLSASGASEPHFYASGARTLKVEWAFAEENLAIPPRATLVGAMTCWSQPDNPACASEGD
jgi:hypothetical protein